jgi:hypothetical protein
MKSAFFAPVLFAAALAATVTASVADEVSDALQAAADAYAAGDLVGTTDAMTIARQAIAIQQNAKLELLLPGAPEGWTMTLSQDFAEGFGMLGGGAGAEARYENADQSLSFTVSYIADNPMVSSMGAMLGNVQMMAMMGTVVKVGDQALLENEGNISALIANRVLVTAEGADTAAMLPVVKAIDFAKLGMFDAN